MPFDIQEEMSERLFGDGAQRLTPHKVALLAIIKGVILNEKLDTTEELSVFLVDEIKVDAMPTRNEIIRNTTKENHLRFVLCKESWGTLTPH